MIQNGLIQFEIILTKPIHFEIMNQLKFLIDEATSIAGSQRKLADLLEIPQGNLSEMRAGKRACNWRVRGKLRAILGEDPAHAFMAAMAEDLETSDREDEKKAASSFKAMLAAFPEGDVWRRRKPTLSLSPFQIRFTFCSAIHSALSYMRAYTVASSNACIRVTTC